MWSYTDIEAPTFRWQREKELSRERARVRARKVAKEHRAEGDLEVLLQASVETLIDERYRMQNPNGSDGSEESD